MQVFKADDKSQAAVADLCFTPDGRGLVTSTSVRVTVWDVTGTPTPQQSIPRKYQEYQVASPVAVSPCGRFLVLWEERRLRVFDLTESRRQPVVELHGFWSYQIAFSPDGTELAVPEITPRQWAVPSWDQISSSPGPWLDLISPFPTGTIAYAPDGRAIASSFRVRHDDSARESDSHIRLFDRVTGELKADFRTAFGHAHPTQIAFSPDGAVIAGNFGPVLGVVRVADGKEVARIKTGKKYITGLAFTPDGSRLVTVGNDTRVRVFDARTWTETTGYEWKIGKLRCVAVAPDGLRMAAGSDRGKVVIWDVDG